MPRKNKGGKTRGNNPKDEPESNAQDQKQTPLLRGELETLEEDDANQDEGVINTPQVDSARTPLEGQTQAPQIVAAPSIPPTNTTHFSPPTEVEEVPTTPFPTNASENPSHIPLPSSPPLRATAGATADVEPIYNSPSGVIETSSPTLPDPATEPEKASQTNEVPNPKKPLPDIESAPSSVEQPEEPAGGAPQPNPSLLKISIPPQQPADTHSNGDALPVSKLGASTDAATPDVEVPVPKSAVSATRAVKRGKKNFASKKTPDEASAQSPRETPTPAGPPRIEDPVTREPQSRAPGDENTVKGKNEPQTVTPQPVASPSPVNGKSTPRAKPVEDAMSNALQNGKVFKVQPASPSPTSTFPAEGQADARSEVPKKHQTNVNPRTPYQSPKITAALISDIIDALGSDQHTSFEFTDHSSPRSTASELESVWSDDSFGMTPAARKLRGASGTSGENNKGNCPSMHIGRTEPDPECINTPPHLILSLSDRESADGDVFLLNKDPSGAGASPEYSDTLVTETSAPTETGVKPIELLPKSWQKISRASSWHTYTLTRTSLLYSLLNNASDDPKKGPFRDELTVGTLVLWPADSRVRDTDGKQYLPVYIPTRHEVGVILERNLEPC